MTLSVAEARKHLHTLLDTSDPAAAPTVYYALFHAAGRSAIQIAKDERGQVSAFAGRFQTGLDLFRPLVTLSSPDPETAATLLADLLVVGRPYIFFAPLNQLPMIGGSLSIENQTIYRIYTVDPRRFQPEVNVLLRESIDANGLPRCEIKQNGQTVSVAGVNWKSPAFAEIYVQTEAIARQKGYGRTVVAGLTALLLKDAIRPIYLAANQDEVSRALVEGLGYVDTGSRQVYADTVYLGHPLDQSPPQA